MKFDNIILFGAGEQNMRTAFNNLSCAGYSVKMIVDSDPNKWGQVFNNVEVVSPKKLREFDIATNEKYYLIITPWTESVINEIKAENSDLKNALIYTYREILIDFELNYKRKTLFKLNIIPVYHCNLKCAGCSVCAPLADGEFFLDLLDLEKDLSRLVDLGAKVSEFFITGGEPILHPQISRFPYIIKKHFPDSEVNIYSNGLILNKMGDDFWQSCKDNDVLIMITKYPVKINYERLRQMVQEKNIRTTFGNTGNEDTMKEMWPVSIDLNGNIDAANNFRKCLNVDYKLKEGRLYPCCVTCDICHLCKTFNVELPWQDSGVDIYKVNSHEELVNRLSVPNPMCSFCDLEQRKKLIPWSLSQKNINEWVVKK